LLKGDNLLIKYRDDATEKVKNQLFSVRHILGKQVLELSGIVTF